MEVNPGRLVVCAFDPGIRSGWAWFDFDRIEMCTLGTARGLKGAETNLGQFDSSKGERYAVGQMVELTRRCWEWADIDEECDTFIVTIENFTLSPTLVSTSPELLSPVRMTARYLDRLETSGIAIWTRSSASEAKNTVTDQRLKLWNQYSSSSGEHARDAQRHGILIARKYASELGFRQWAGLGLSKKEAA
jgi:hypothetical protein